MNKRTVKIALWALAAALLLAADARIAWTQSARDAQRAAGAAIAASGGEAQDPLERFRLEREQLRAMAEARLNDIAHAENADAASVAQAREQLMDMLSRAEAEQALEGTLRARGFEDAVVSISGGSANVLVRTDTLTQRESAVILELVLRQTGLTGGNVKIIPVK